MGVNIENFKTVFGINNNIRALRNKVFELAIHGKLVEQDQNDEPASELVYKIKLERDMLVKEGKIKVQKSLLQITAKEKFFDIPDSWEWVRCNEVLDVRDGTHDTPKYVSSGYPLVTSKNLDNGKLNFNNIKYICQEDYNIINQRSYVESEDILFAMIGSIGNPVVVEKYTDFAIKNVALIKNLPNKYIDIFYLYYYLLKEQEVMKKVATGGVQSFVSLSYLRNYVIPIPPQAEQHRIVTKIKFIMLEIDKLEESLQKKEHLMELLPKAIVDVIGKCKTGEELKVQLQLAIENFETIFQTPKSIQELRNVVLQLAIEGKLVPQDNTDEPASELIKMVQFEKGKLVKEGKIKKKQPLDLITEEDISFEIPESWQWVRLGTLSQLIGDGLHGTPIYTDDGDYHFINGNNLSEDGIIIRDVTKRVPLSEYEKYKKNLNNRTILISINGTLGNVAYYNDEKVILGKSACYFNLFECILKDYIKTLIKGAYFFKYANEKSTGTTIKNLSLNAINLLPIPLPPAKEQHRIVQKVESIMTLIDQMEVEMKRKVDLVEKMASI